MNNLLRAYRNFDVVSGWFSCYSELIFDAGKVRGYVKPLFRKLDVYDKGQDRDKAALDKVREGAIEDLSSGKCPSRGSGHKSRRLGKIGRSTHGHCASRASAHPKRILQGHPSWIRAGIWFENAADRLLKRRVNKAIGRTITSFVKSRLYLAFTLRETLHASRLGLSLL